MSSIDLKHLDQYVCGDAALLDEILTIFEEQAEMWMSRFDADLSDEDWRNAAHALKGASRGVGAWVIGDLCEHGETLIAGASEIGTKRRQFILHLEEKLSAAVSDARRIRKAA
jgi:HPt (histidine-containing phosphotransfer) domain-containing protein